jgi:Trk-type K+ transport system membrane component
VVNLLNYLKYKFITLFSSKISKYRPWVLNLNSRITLITTLSITIFAFFIFYFLEYDNTLAEHEGIGKIVTALFGATTPRTAGFNTIDSSAMTTPTILLVFLLMWIGASPQSTGGGIKTSTFAIATLNILSLAKGKSKIEIFRREIAEISVRRAFAIISLSLVVIGFAIMFISIFDPEKQLLDIAFECFSAYSTVGLSLNFTPTLTEPSKYVLIATMFIGRIGMLNLMIGLLRQMNHQFYEYPKENILIN